MVNLTPCSIDTFSVNEFSEKRTTLLAFQMTDLNFWEHDA
jgi:hypothetical protein